MSSIVNRHSPLANHFRKKVVPALEPPHYAPVLERRDFNGSRNLFDAGMLTACVCEILPIHFQPKKLSPLLLGWEAADKQIRNRWSAAIQKAGEPDLLEQDYLALDNELHLQSNIHMVLRWDSKTFVVNCCYLPTDEFRKVKSTCAKKKDVYQISAGILLLNADAGLIVYEDAQDFELFGVARSPRIFAAIEKKCRWMRDLLLLKHIPSCSHQRV